MRIVAGRFRGHRLAPVPRRGVRPTADPVREALFNILGNEVEGKPFIDLCAGTGAVGLEAFSRGASPVVLVERDRQALATLRRNLEILRLGDREPVFVAGAEVLRWLENPAEWSDFAPAGVVFLDPPYGDHRLARWLARLARHPLAGPESLVIVEHASSDPPPGEGFAEAWRRRYGDSALWAGRPLSGGAG